MYKNMTPEEIVLELDKFIIGQDKAKKAVAIALRNRWRRMQLKEDIKSEVTPKNILMIGPTGVGKTEIARRLAKLSSSPFIKIEATKFTEVGYVGKEVDSIIRDLTDYAVKIIKINILKENLRKVKILAENRILDILVPKPKGVNWDKEDVFQNNLTRESFRKKLRNGSLDKKEIEINLSISSMGIEILSPPGMEEMTSQLQSIFQNLGGYKKKIRKLFIKDALKLLMEEESSKLINFDDLKRKSIRLVEQQGIVFIDEIDKICKRSEFSDAGISREGVQRDLLPLVEGCTVSTKYGIVKTDHILFIASGSFHLCSPSDLIPELQGRLPIKVRLKALTTKDFKRILTEPNVSITMQYKELLKTENINIDFTEDGIECIANISWKVNENKENIGARRLYSVLETLMEELSFNIKKYKDKSIIIDAKYVNSKFKHITSDENLNRFIL